MSATSIHFVVAIDFGTTYSGYAFLPDNGDFRDISLNPQWNSGTKLYSSKTPTSLLLTKEGEFVKYGYDAEKMYEDLLLNKTEKHYLYFRRFKMELYSRTNMIHNEMKIKDIHGTEHSALSVFSLSVKALCDHCIETLRDQGNVLPNKYAVKWVVTVPAIWSDEAKMFTRKACEMAGIPVNRLLIALEPEVASLYCFELKNPVFKPGEKCLVVDLGGGTVDICGLEIMKKGLFKQIFAPTGNSYGGAVVDKEFENVLQDILGESNMKKFKEQYTSSYLDLMIEFETEKRMLCKDQTEKMNIKIPMCALNNLNLNKDFLTLIQESEYADKMSVENEKLRIDPVFAKSLFNIATTEINSTICKILQQKDARKISFIILVGGFAESKIIQETVKAAFKDKKVVIPRDPTIAVLKGAVMFGVRPDVITTRFTQFTYGRKIKPIFNKKQHDQTRMVTVGRESRCDGVFEPLVKNDTKVPVGKTVSKSYHTISNSQSDIRIALYKSISNTTKYIDEDGCFLVGECFIPIQTPSETRRMVDVEFKFGDTEIFITSTEKDTKKVLMNTFQLQ